MGLLDGKVAIVTGAGQGLGRAHALALADAGASVVVNDVRDPDGVVKEITAAGGKAVANNGSVSDWSAAEAMVQQAVSEFGDLHILLNNAGFTRDRMIFNMSEEEFDAVVDVHLKGHFCMSRHAMAWWREQSKAGATAPRRIINTTSESGLTGAIGQPNYAPAKAGIVSLTVSCARALERFNGTANAYAPRAKTDMTANVQSIDPVKHDPANTSPFVVWLASDEAADVTAQTFLVLANEVHLVSRPEVLTTIEKDERWKPEEFTARKADLFGGHSQGLPGSGLA